MADVTRVTELPEANFGDPEELQRRTIQAVNDLQKGKGNNHDLCILEPNATQTECFNINANIGGIAVLSAMSPSAATAVAAGVIWVEVVNNNVVIHHDSSPLTDRKFGVVQYG